MQAPTSANLLKLLQLRLQTHRENLHPEQGTFPSQPYSVRSQRCGVDFPAPGGANPEEGCQVVRDAAGWSLAGDILGSRLAPAGHNACGRAERLCRLGIILVGEQAIAPILGTLPVNPHEWFGGLRIAASLLAGTMLDVVATRVSSAVVADTADLVPDSAGMCVLLWPAGNPENLRGMCGEE